MIEPLVLSYTIGCEAVDAFETWTSRFSMWWPKSHSASGDHDSKFFVEPGLGGRIYERTTGGSEIDWGEVTTWDPLYRLGYLWHLRRDRSDATDVMIEFGRSRRRHHPARHRPSGWERLGVGAEQWRDANRSGWESLMKHFRVATESADQSDWMPLGSADEQKPAAAGSVEEWARSADNPVGGWYGLKKGLRGRFANYVPPVMEMLGLAVVEHNPRNNRMRAISG